MSDPKEWVPKALNDNHRMVIQHVLSGMSKTSAYKMVYPECKSNKSAYQSAQRILKAPEARAYYESELHNQRQFIDNKNEMDMNSIASIFSDAVQRSKTLCNLAQQTGDLNAMASGINVMTKAVKEFCMVFGRGTYDPSVRLNVAVKVQKEVDKFKKDFEAKNKALVVEEEPEQFEGEDALAEFL